MAGVSTRPARAQQLHAHSIPSDRPAHNVMGSSSSPREARSGFDLDHPGSLLDGHRVAPGTWPWFLHERALGTATRRCAPMPRGGVVHPCARLEALAMSTSSPPCVS